MNIPLYLLIAIPCAVVLSVVLVKSMFKPNEELDMLLNSGCCCGEESVSEEITKTGFVEGINSRSR